MPRQPIHSDRAPAAIGPYSQAVRAGDTVYLSGQIPLDPATGLLVEGDIDAQARRVFDNLSAVCEAAGGVARRRRAPRPLPHRPRPFAAVNAVMAEYFAAPYPGALDDRGGRAAARRAVRGRRDPRPRLTRPTHRVARVAATDRPAFAAVGDAPLSTLAGVGPRVAEKLAARGLLTLQDLWLHLPRAYEDRTVAHADPRAAAGRRGAGRRRASKRSSAASAIGRAARGDRRRLAGARWCCASSTSARSRRRSSRRARACAATARRARARTGWRSCIRVTACVGEARRCARRAPRSGVSGDRRHRPGALRKLIGQALDRLPDADALELLPRGAARGARTCRRCARRCSPCTARRAMPTSPRLLAGTHPAQQRLALEELLAHHLSLRRQRIALQRASRARARRGGRAGASACARRCRSR